MRERGLRGQAQVREHFPRKQWISDNLEEVVCLAMDRIDAVMLAKRNLAERAGERIMGFKSQRFNHLPAPPTRHWKHQTTLYKNERLDSGFELHPGGQQCPTASSPLGLRLSLPTQVLHLSHCVPRSRRSLLGLLSQMQWHLTPNR